MKRALAIGLIMCALPLFGTTYRYGTCEIEMTGQGTFWQRVKAFWTIQFGDCGPDAQ